MSDAPQGMFAYPGVKTVLSGSFTLSHGISPSMATIYISPQEGWIPKQGPLTISYGSVLLKFEDCVADRGEAQRGPDGMPVWALHLLDRRWKWRKCGTISGYYNVRRGFGEDAGGNKLASIVEATKKTARELAKLCLEAMKEKGYDVEALPEEDWPEVEWDYTLPAEALARLCDTYSCRIVLHLNGRVKIEKIGEGKNLALGTTGLDGGISADSPEIPDKLVLVTAPVRWQYDFDIEPIGLDVDGDIKPIDDLSYKPKDGWAKSDVPNFNDVTTEVKAGAVNAKTTYKTTPRQLAQETVFRWFRIKVTAAKDDKKFKPIKLPPNKEAIDDLDRILPIEDKQITTRQVGKRIEPLPAQVWGRFFPGYESTASQIAFLPEAGADLSKVPDAIYTKGFTIDRELGIVKFSEPVFLYGESKELNDHMPPELRLRTTVSLRDKETRGWIRHEFEREMGGPPRNTQPQYLQHDDVFYNVISQGDQASNTEAEAEKAAKHYLDAVEKQYQTTDPSSFTYGGIQKIDVDGAIQQVTWNVSDDGFATTRASRNREELLVVPSYNERRMMERLQDALTLQNLTTRTRKEAMERGKA
jgi:hypothetical protein